MKSSVAILIFGLIALMAFVFIAGCGGGSSSRRTPVFKADSHWHLKAGNVCQFNLEFPIAIYDKYKIITKASSLEWFYTRQNNIPSGSDTFVVTFTSEKLQKYHVGDHKIPFKIVNKHNRKKNLHKPFNLRLVVYL